LAASYPGSGIREKGKKESATAVDAAAVAGRKAAGYDGQIFEAVTLLDGKVLIGWHRVLPAIELGLPLPIRKYDPIRDGPDPVARVYAENLTRKHYTEGQRAAYAAERASLKRGRPTKSGHVAGLTQATAADGSGSSPRSVRRAIVARDRAIPPIWRALKNGLIDTQTAEKCALLTPREQRAVLAKAKANCNDINRDLKTALENHRRVKRNTRLAASAEAARATNHSIRP